MKRSLLLFSLLCVGMSAQAIRRCVSCKVPRKRKAIEEPAQVTKKMPAVKKPAPAVKKPAPVAKKPAPVAKKPAPAAKKPAPAAKKPAPKQKSDRKAPAAGQNRLKISRTGEYGAAIDKHPVVVGLFSTTWCGPCKQLKPEFEAAIKEMPDVMFVLIDGDEFPELVQRHGVGGYPTMKVHKDGQPVGEVWGRSKSEIKSEIRGHTK